VQVARNIFLRVFEQAGESTLVSLDLASEGLLKVLIQDAARDPVRGDVIHVDFRQVDMNKPVEVSAVLSFVGESPAVKLLGGTLLKAREEIAIRCFPDKLGQRIEVDLSALVTFDDVIHVSDLTLPPGVEILESPTQTVAVVERPRSVEELQRLDEAEKADVSSVELLGKKRAEETETPASAGEPEAKKGAASP
jgi:large subunit ribosomal protein L25